MRTRRHRAIAKANTKYWNARLKEMDEFLTKSGFERSEVNHLYPFQKAHLVRTLRDARKIKTERTIIGSRVGGTPTVLGKEVVYGIEPDFLMGVDYSSGEDKTSIVTMEKNPDGEYKVKSVEQY